MKEEELCQGFKEIVEKVGGVVYAETAGFDMLVVGPDGLQIGIEAKLRANVDVLVQALNGDVWPGRPKKAGPDYRAVLVPKCSEAFRVVAGQLHVWVFDLSGSNADIVNFDLQFFSDFETYIHNHYVWQYNKACWVPPTTFNIPAGVPSPRSVTPWKIGAVRLCMRLRAQGFVTSRDFTECGIAFSPYWRRKLRGYGRVQRPSPNGRKTVLLMRYIQRNGSKLPDEENPTIVDGLRALDQKAAA